MNISSMINENHNNENWRPFATSTPLKPFPNSLMQRPLRKPVDTLNAVLNKVYSNNSCDIYVKNSSDELKTKPKCYQKVKTNRRNRGPYYFDVSSSSEDEESSEKYKVPEIKILNENSTKKKSYLKIKVCENKSLVKERSSGKNFNKHNKLEEIKNKKNIVIEHHDFNDVKNNSVHSAICNKKPVNSIESHEKLNSNNLEVKLKKLESNKKSQLSEVSKAVSNKCKASKNTQADPNSKVKKKTVTSDIKKSDNESKENQVISPLHIWEKGNLTHQLFSDSKEQEHLDSLDLTTVDFNECDKNLQSPCKKIETLLKVDEIKHKTKLKKDVYEKKGVKRSSRQKQAPKKFWLSESKATESIISLKKEKNAKEVLKNTQNIPKVESTENHKIHTVISPQSKEEKKFEIENVAEEYFAPNQLKLQKPEELLADDKEIKKSLKSSTVKNSNKKENVKNENIKNNKETKQVVSKRHTKSKKNENNLESNGASEHKEPIKPLKDEKVITENFSGSSKPILPDLFRRLDQLKFCEESQAGCFTSECWSLKNFKCGIFKVQSKSQLSAATSHNSYFGLVLLRGSLKITIEKEELQLNEGDMACIPPLKEWSAFNNSETESVVYYWCGKFKT